MRFERLIKALETLDLADMVFGLQVQEKDQIATFRWRKTGLRYKVAIRLFSILDNNNFYYQNGLFIAGNCQNARKDYMLIADIITKEVGYPINYIHVY